MIVGIGTDIVEIEKLRLAMVRRGERLRNRAFTEIEIAYCEERASRYQHYAVRFAAKEAVFKALGTGWAAGVTWKDIEVQRLPSGKPELHLYGEALARATAMGASRFHVSLTHDRLVSCAVAVLESA